MEEPRDNTEQEVDRLSLDLPVEDIDFIERYAEYRNALRAAEGVKTKRKWSRKSMGESEFSIRVALIKQGMARVFAEFGPLPGASEKSAMLAYAKRVNEWDKRQPPPEICRHCGSEIESTERHPRRSR